MFKPSRIIIAATVGSFFTPMLALAQDADSGANGHNTLSNLIWGVLPFIMLGVLFWFFFVRQVRRQQNSPLVKRHQAYMDAHEQHMKRMEQLVERIAVALEKDRP